MVRVIGEGSPHPLTGALRDRELPYAYEPFTTWDRRWTPLVQVEGHKELASLLAGELGKGRMLLYGALDTFGEQHPGGDEFLAASLAWLSGRLGGDEAKLRAGRQAEVRQALNDLVIGEADFEAGLLGSMELDVLRLRLRRAAAACPDALALLVRGHGRRAEIAAELQKSLKPGTAEDEKKD